MNKNGVEIDDSQVMEFFKGFNQRERNKTFKGATRNALNIVRREAIKNLKKHTNAIDKADKYGNTLRKGIKVSVYRSAKEGSIHILKNFKLKWFEKDTQERWQIYKSKNDKVKLKKPRRLGKMTGHHFFKDAKESKEKEVFETLEKIINKEIIKIYNKAKGKRK